MSAADVYAGLNIVLKTVAACRPHQSADIKLKSTEGKKHLSYKFTFVLCGS